MTGPSAWDDPMRLMARVSGMALFVFLVWFLVLPTSASAQDGVTNPAFKSGTQLYQACTSAPESENMAFCIGYVMGVSDSLQGLKLTCSPREIRAKQTIDLVVSYLRDHASSQQYVAAQEVTLALVKAFPCKK